MLISRHWLQKFFDAELPPAEMLAEALTFHAFEIDGVQKVDPRQGDEASDYVLDVKVTPNRGHDALSHRGIAKELSAILNLPLVHDPLADMQVLAPVTPAVSVTVQRPDLCRRYIAGYIQGVTVAPSPAWLRARLEALGQRSINNVVDATNFVMFNLGQPLHAFDAGKLGSLQLGVRLAKEGEKMIALDKKEYALNESMLVITAGEQAVGIAGIKGGSPAAIDETTTDIVIESANFDGPTTRKTAQTLKLRTDASARFEQLLSPELAAYGMRAAADLVIKLAGGELEGFVDVYPEPPAQRSVAVSVDAANALLGSELTQPDVSNAFTRLGFSYKEERGVFEVVPPFERLDLEIPEDLIEEIGRVSGYDKIAEKQLPAAETTPAINSNFYTAEKVREELAGEGYSEVYTSVFAKKGERAVLNKVDSEKPYLRTNLSDGLAEALKKNIPSKDLLALREIKLFEIGPVWRGGEEIVLVGTISEKEPAAEKPLADYAETVPAAYESLPLSGAPRYQPFSKYPYIVRDIALWVPAQTKEETVLSLIQKEAGTLAVRTDLFDRFEKEGRVSLAYRIIFQSPERTLVEKEVNELMEKISAALKQQGFEIR